MQIVFSFCIITPMSPVSVRALQTDMLFDSVLLETQECVLLFPIK